MRHHHTCLLRLQSSLRCKIWYRRRGISTTTLWTTTTWYISHDDLLRDGRDYTGVLGSIANISANHENASGVSTDPQEQGLVDQIRDLIRRDLLTPAAPLPGAASPAEPLPGAVREPLLERTLPLSGGGASPETGELSPAPVPATARKGAAIRNNRIHRPNVVTRRAAAEPTGAVARYRGVCPNNRSNDKNNNNHSVLAELFQPRTLYKLRQLGIYTNTDTPDTPHQLDTEAVAAEVAYTRTNTQPSYSRGGELGCIPSTFKEAMGLPQAARWKAVSDKEIASLGSTMSSNWYRFPQVKGGPLPSARKTARRTRYSATVWKAAIPLTPQE